MRKHINSGGNNFTLLATANTKADIIDIIEEKLPWIVYCDDCDDELMKEMNLLGVDVWNLYSCTIGQLMLIAEAVDGDDLNFMEFPEPTHYQFAHGYGG